MSESTTEKSKAEDVLDKDNNETKYTKDDLIELVRAIKFSQPDASIRIVHTEITTKMSQNESFEFLNDVKLNDVKKVWKKAISGGRCDGGASSNSNVVIKGHTDSHSVKQILLDGRGESMDGEQSKKGGSGGSNKKSKGKMNEILKFYTVGDGSVQTLAKSYTLLAAANAVAQENALEEAQNEEEMKKYVSCFLDVPADRSGGKPHQALINFNDKNANKKDGKTKKGGGNSSDGRDIVKIQVAAALPGMDNTPMLLYNFDRSAKTFIHHDNDDGSQGYEKIKEMITSHGSSGALKGGGTKAYFYSFITRRKGETDLISIDTSQLAPTQRW